MHIRPKGLEKMRLCGRRRKLIKDVLSEFLRVAWPDAFCIIALGIKVSGGLRHGEKAYSLVNDCD